MQYRRASLKDVPALVEARKKQLVDEGFEPVASIDEQLDDYFRRKLSDGSLIEWLAEDEGVIVATAAIAFLELPPVYNNTSGIRGYITNMYTAPAYRGRGIASRMLEWLMEEAREREVTKVFLGSSKMGRSVYERFGFHGSPKWMELDL